MDKTLLVLLAAGAGLIVGSFLNVVIARLPVMLQRAWYRDMVDVIGAVIVGPETRFINLSMPRSHCPHCGHRLRWYELVPVLSWALQRGRCRACQAGISMRYPLIELLTAALTAAVAARFGLSSDTVLLSGLMAALLALAVIDIDTLLLPDDITQPLLWLGLIVAWLCPALASLPEAMLGVTIGFVVCYLPAQAARLLIGQDAMGAGDTKLLAAVGAWLGPAVIVAAAVAFVLNLVAHIALRKRALPFGPAVAIATGLVVLLPEAPGLAWLIAMLSFSQ